MNLEVEKKIFRLKKSFQNIYHEDTEYIESERFKKNFTSSQLKVKPKIANIAGLQLSDLIAHPGRRQILIYLNFLSKKKEIFGDKIIESIKSKYYSYEGTVFGYGIKILP